MPILAAVDNESGSEALVSVGAELAEGLGEEFVVCHVIPERKDPGSAREAISTTVERAIGDADMATITIRQGRTVDYHVLEEAKEIDADYIIVGSRKQTPVGKALLGSVAQRIILNSDVPVVSVPQSE